MDKKKSLGAMWFKYFLARDKAAKLVALGAIVFIALWVLVFKDSMSVLIPLAVFAATLVFSFLSFIAVGLPRMATETKLYDAIDSDCKFPSKYKGRAMDRIKVEWGWVIAKKVTIQPEISSSAVTSSSTWRSLRSSVSDAFTRGRINYITIFDEHERGILTFIQEGMSDPAIEANYRRVEDLTSFVYDSLDKYGHALPRIRNLVMGIDGNEDLPASFSVSLSYQAESYNKKSFERDFKQKYDNPNVIWVFKWSGLGVEISHVLRGTEAERKQYVAKTLADLISASYSTAFTFADKDYTFSDEMVDWDKDLNPERLTIDFMHTDVSRVDKQERFEQLVTQGLHQIFKTPYWDFQWTVSPYEKILTIIRTEAPAGHHEPSPVGTQEKPALVTSTDNSIEEYDEEANEVLPDLTVDMPDIDFSIEEYDEEANEVLPEKAPAVVLNKTEAPKSVPAAVRSMPVIRKMPAPPARPQLIRPASKP